MTTYIITTQANSVQNMQLQDLVRTDPHIKAYWNYIQSVYCVKTSLSSKELRQKIDFIFPLGGFLIAELNPSNIDGRLPEKAWMWFQEQSDLESMRYSNNDYNTLIEGQRPRGLLGLDTRPSPKARKKALF